MQKQTIALIDDDRNILTSLSIALEKEGFKVQTYIDGESALIGLTRMPPDLAADIVDRGVMLTGGGALLGDLDLALREQTGLAISVADESLNCVALGTGKSLEFEKQLAHVIDYGS